MRASRIWRRFSCFRHWDTQIRKFSEAYLLISKQLTFCPQKVTKTGQRIFYEFSVETFFASTEGVSLQGINDAANTLYLFHVCWVIVLLQRYAFSYYK